MSNLCEVSVKAKGGNIGAELAAMEKIVALLSETLAELKQRIQPVSLPSEEPEISTVSKQPDRPRCEVDTAIQVFNYRLSEQTNSARRMIEELQI